MQEPPLVVENQVPDYLLRCKDEPVAPNVRTGNYSADFKRLSVYIAEVKTAGRDCRSKLKDTAGLIRKGPTEKR